MRHRPLPLVVTGREIGNPAFWLLFPVLLAGSLVLGALLFGVVEKPLSLQPRRPRQPVPAA